MISLVIPAHNEEGVIGRLLSALVSKDDKQEIKHLQIVVVCNGCTDDTAKVARKYVGVEVVEIAKASKIAALNAGDQIARGYPRIYVDADVVVSHDALQQIAMALEQEGCLAAAPQMQMDFGNSGWLVRLYYKVWMLLPYTREGMMGVGVYGLSEKGRGRFGRFPDVIADDGYVRLLFNKLERSVVKEAKSLVHAPATFVGLIKIKTRSRLGLYQLREKYPELFERERQSKSYGSALAVVCSHPGLWLAGMVYFMVNVTSRLRAKYQRGRVYVWERDESSRK